LGDRSTNLPYKSSSDIGMKQEPIFYTRNGGELSPGSRNRYNQGCSSPEREPVQSEYHDSYQPVQPQGDSIYWTSHNSDNNQYPYQNRNRRGYHHNNYRYNPYASKREKFDQRPYQQRGSQRPVNSETNGKTSSPGKRKCFLCQQPDHVCADCPYNNFPKKEQQCNRTEGNSRQRQVFAIFKPELPLPECDLEKVFPIPTGQSGNKALIDTGACVTVCGKEWLTEFENSLSLEDKELIEDESTDVLIQFGDCKPVKAISLRTIPITFCGVDILLRTYVVDNTIPLLLSRRAMTAMGMIINMQEMTIKIQDGVAEKMEITNSGHFAVCFSSQDKEKTTVVKESKESCVERKNLETQPHYTSAGKDGLTKKGVSRNVLSEIMEKGYVCLDDYLRR